MELKDYSVHLTDSTGGIVKINISADAIRDVMRSGSTLDRAVDDVEQNAFQNAIDKGLIGPECWVYASR